MQVHKDKQPHNSQAARTCGAIVLGQSDNLQGGYKFLALNTGKKISRYSWDAIPIPDTVIALVEALAGDQPEHLIFTNRHGRPIGYVGITGADKNELDDKQTTDTPLTDLLTPIDPVYVNNDKLPGVDKEASGQTVEFMDLDITQAEQAEQLLIPEQAEDPITPITTREYSDPSNDVPVPKVTLCCSSQVQTQTK